MMYHRPELTGTAMLMGAVVLGIASGFLFVQGIFAAFERPLNAAYRAHNH